MTTSYWTQTMGRFRPSLASDEKKVVGHPELRLTQITTHLTNEKLIDQIILDHMTRSKRLHSYDSDDYSDEIRIRTWDGSRWRTLINLQLEGQDNGI